MLCLIEGKYTNFIVLLSHRYQAKLMSHTPYPTTEEKRQRFYWPNWIKELSVFVSHCAGCLHREVIDLKDTIWHKNCALCVNQMLCMYLVSLLPLSNNKNKYILSIFDHLYIFVVSW